jgi:hypothetical protein
MESVSQEFRHVISGWMEGKGWTNLPESKMPLLELTLNIRLGTWKTFFALIYTSGADGYDRVRICRSRNGDDMAADLAVGHWSDWWLDTFSSRGSDVEGYIRMKLVNLSPTADMFELFVPQIWPREGYTAPEDLAQDIDRQVGFFSQNPAREALGTIDDDTYFELLEEHNQCLAYTAEVLAKKCPWDLLMVETHAPDYADHFFLGQSDEESGASPETIKRCRDGLIRTFSSIDRMVGRLMELGDDETLFLLCSDHGGTPDPVWDGESQGCP